MVNSAKLSNTYYLWRISADIKKTAGLIQLNGKRISVLELSQQCINYIFID
jgi:hypothetical protein